MTTARSQPEGVVAAHASRSRVTIPTRILAATLSLIFAFFVGSVTSVVTHQRSAQTLRLLHEGYLPLALTLARARSDQAAYGSMLARMLNEPDSSASREWVNRAVRVVMPASIDAALGHVARAQRLEPSGEDAILLGELAELLGEVQRGYANTQHLDAYFRALERGDRSEAQDALDALRQQDRTLTHNLRRSFDHIQRRVAAISSVAAEEQSRSVWITAVMTVLGLLFGLVVSLWARRLLAPLPRLEARVLEVAAGNLAAGPPVVDPGRTDEIGRLAIELDAMVEALRARDQQLREAADRVIRSERLAAMGRMAAHVTHEVRNPLTSIHLNTEMLEEEITLALGEGARNDEVRKLLVSIRREVDRLGSITEEYLRLARLPSPKLEPEDLGALSREVVTFVRREMAGSGIDVAVEVTPALPLVSADEAQIRQALLNLLRNARDAMASGGDIRVSVAHEGEQVVVRVADRGEGVPEEVRAKMFDAFYSTKERGTGLGLPLTQQIVLAHRGTIHCEDREGGGAVFVLSFPAIESSALLPARRDEAVIASDEPDAA
ncbi:MAG: HAMP domain-containing protein [Deltaproteobacteria bacterium]|nr:HAMP domain-containing protein [Deltaproteobacteria bacterium]